MMEVDLILLGFVIGWFACSLLALHFWPKEKPKPPNPSVSVIDGMTPEQWVDWELKKLAA